MRFRATIIRLLLKSLAPPSNPKRKGRQWSRSVFSHSSAPFLSPFSSYQLHLLLSFPNFHKDNGFSVYTRDASVIYSWRRELCGTESKIPLTPTKTNGVWLRVWLLLSRSQVSFGEGEGGREKERKTTNHPNLPLGTNQKAKACLMQPSPLSPPKTNRKTTHPPTHIAT